MGVFSDAVPARFAAPDLRAFASSVLKNAGVPDGAAAIVAEVLVAADLRGVSSHGLGRLESFYVEPIRSGAIDAAAPITTLTESPTTIALDAHNGLGHPASVRAMTAVIEKAGACGIAAGTVRCSNHHGMTGYYAMSALDHGMIGVAASNTARLMAPTLGREVLLGNSPLAVAVPALGSDAFVLDMAMSTVAMGKIEVAARSGHALKPGWALDGSGRETLDPAKAESLEPLGGASVATGGHKGYALSLLVEMLTLLGGGAFGRALPAAADMFAHTGSTSHFFLALDIARFRSLSDFRIDAQELLRQLRESTPALGMERVYTPGEPDAAATAFNTEHGVPLHEAIVTNLARLGRECDITLPQPLTA
jgi:L-2-hydroxycarboxylate dehydrogenase (NAD+)